MHAAHSLPFSPMSFRMMPFRPMNYSQQATA